MITLPIGSYFLSVNMLFGGMSVMFWYFQASSSHISLKATQMLHTIIAPHHYLTNSITLTIHSLPSIESPTRQSNTIINSPAP